MIGGVLGSWRDALAAHWGVGWAELGEAQRFDLRFALPVCVGLPAEAGSRPGGRGTFFVRTKKVPKESCPASTPRLWRGALCCSRRRGPAELALAALGAQTVLGPAVLRTSEPDNAALLGVSEGEGKASTFHRCRISVAWMQAEGRNPGCAVEHLDTPAPDSAAFHPGCEQRAGVARRMVLISGPVESVEWRSGVGGSARSADGEDCLRPAGPSSAAARFREHAREVRHLCLTANAGSPFLGYFFWRSKRSNTPAGGGTPANARQQTDCANRKSQSPIRKSSVGLGTTLPDRRAQSATRAVWGVDSAAMREYRIQNTEARTASPFTTIPLRENRS
ncbi:hypothetical protein GGR36_002600 [Niveibacterium umoris]|uniref:Uncharacterized protein n=1 Tax=Niveibacterium umoris TaxID=1193620 RepID=A0A840BLC3_9RHOO|nr:hypothetical protein [Niveibacterium umoris]